MRIVKNRWILENLEATLGRKLEIEKCGRRVVFVRYVEDGYGRRTVIVRLHPLEALNIMKTLGLVYA